MSVFKCKMCGATLNIPKDTNVFKCEYCDTEQTVPIINSQEKEELYDRANYFFHNNEYDKAAKIYEDISNLDPHDPESYFMFSLCKYGIEYVEDPKSKKRIPTLHRLHYEPISNDVNYKKAIKHADSTQKIIYENQAKYIDEVRNRILEISKKEKPYDVFICYKETDERGQRTEDSVLAMDIYNELTKEGLKVFFSRITLEGKLGVEYESYIFAALNSAKVMVVVGTKPEYINSPWVRNEWTRFIDRVNVKQSNKKNTEKCYIVPAYKGMSPYALPNEFSSIQAQDMSKVGATQDLVHGIKKLLNKMDANETNKVKKSLNRKQKLLAMGAVILLMVQCITAIVNLRGKSSKKVIIRGVEYVEDEGYNSLFIKNVNDFKEDDIDKLNKLGIIKTLYFRNCELDNLEFLPKLKNVEGLHFIETVVKDTSLKETCENIKSITLGSNDKSVWDSIEYLNNMPNLEEISIVCPKNMDLSPIANHKKLNSIKLESWRSSTVIEDLSWCVGLTNVKHLKIVNSSLLIKGDDPFNGIEFLSNIENLTLRFDINGVLNEKMMRHFSKLKKLISLDLNIFEEGNKLMSDLQLVSFKCFETANNIEKIKITSKNYWDLSGLDNLLQLKEIELQNSYVTNDNLEHLRYLENLESLQFSVTQENYNGNRTFSFKGVEELEKLKVLNCSVNCNVKILDEELLKNIDGLYYQIN